MTRPLVPIANLQRRLPELGRIRTGQKTERAMKALSAFRFTSQDRTALEQVATLYGGTVRPWEDPKAAPNQFEVVTDAAEIQVALPPDPLGGTPVYELWGGGGCERRCDGVTCEGWVKGPEGPEPADQPCICHANGDMACDPKTRLSVILPNVRGIGTWRLETKSWNAAQELPGMVDLIQSLQAKGITRATLRLEHKRTTQAGVTRKFIVPVLGLDASVEALVAGDATVGQLGGGPPQIGTGVGGNGSGGTPTPEIPAATQPPPEHISLNQTLSDREIIQPEVVDANDPWARHNPRARALAAKVGWDDDAWHTAIGAITDGRSTSSRDLTDDEWADLIVVLEAAPAPEGTAKARLANVCTDGRAKAGATKRANRLTGHTGSFDDMDETSAIAVLEDMGL